MLHQLVNLFDTWSESFAKILLDDVASKQQVDDVEVARLVVSELD